MEVYLSKWWEMLREGFKTQWMIQNKVVTQKLSPKKNITVKMSNINTKNREKMFRSGKCDDICRYFWVISNVDTLPTSVSAC